MEKKRWNKSGQFYLIAAIVIISLIIGFIGIANYSKKKSSEKMNYLRDELNIETAYIVQYGINNNGTSLEAINYMLYDTADFYVNETIIEEIYFVLADMSIPIPRVAVSAWANPFPDSIIIDGSTKLFEGKTFSDNYKDLYYTPTANSTTIKINNISYTFDLKPGVNIYFVISNGDYVASNKNF